MRENQPPWSVQLTIDPRAPEKNLSFMTELDASMQNNSTVYIENIQYFSISLNIVANDNMI